MATKSKQKAPAGLSSFERFVLGLHVPKAAVDEAEAQRKKGQRKPAKAER
jgi:hypothetical protein